MTWHHHGSRHTRGYDSRWVKLRLIILARDAHLCQPCLRLGRPTPATAVDHIINKAKGGTDDPDNLQSICGPCHDEKSLAEASDKPNKPQYGADGWTIT
jgi:5-methylcytosine-specific restriction protein A